jgi:hypothetical protein
MRGIQLGIVVKSWKRPGTVTPPSTIQGPHVTKSPSMACRRGRGRRTAGQGIIIVKSMTTDVVDSWLRYLNSGHEAFDLNFGQPMGDAVSSGRRHTSLKLRLSFHRIVPHGSILERPLLAAAAPMWKRERHFLPVGYLDFAGQLKRFRKENRFRNAASSKRTLDSQDISPVRGPGLPRRVLH